MMVSAGSVRIRFARRDSSDVWLFLVDFSWSGRLDRREHHCRRQGAQSEPEPNNLF
jgi:hypothetical protein